MDDPDDDWLTEEERRRLDARGFDFGHDKIDPELEALEAIDHVIEREVEPYDGASLFSPVNDAPTDLASSIADLARAVTAYRDNGTMRLVFSQIETEVINAIRRISFLDRAPTLRLTGDTLGKRIAVFTVPREDLDATLRLTRAALERVRDFASELGHAVNAAAPSGVRWTVALSFCRRDLMKPPMLEVYWAVILDPDYQLAE